MTRLILFVIIIVGAGILIASVVRRTFNRVFNVNENNDKKSDDLKNKNKSQILYKRNDVVVMKGDAPEHSENNSVN